MTIRQTISSLYARASGATKSQAPSLGKFKQLTQNEQFQLALPVLVSARAKHLSGAGPIHAMRHSTEVPIEWVYAQRAFESANRGINLLSWELHGGVLKSDGTRFFDRAIRLARRAFGHRGGWVVSAAGGAP